MLYNQRLDRRTPLSAIFSGGMGLGASGGNSTFLSASIDPTGLILTINLSTNVAVTGNGGLSMSDSSLIYRSGSGTASPTFWRLTPAIQGSSPTLAYSGSGLSPSPASFSGQAVTNGTASNPDVILNTLDPTTVFYSDSGTTPVTTPGSNVFRWAAPTTGISANVPYMQTLDTAPVLQKEGNTLVVESAAYGHSLNYALTQTLTGYTVFHIYRKIYQGNAVPPGVNTGLSSLASNWGFPGQLDSYNSVGTGGVNFNITGNNVIAFAMTNDTSWHVIALTFDGSNSGNVHIYQDGAQIGPGSPGTVGPYATGNASISQTAYTIGRVAGGVAANGRYAATISYPSVLTDAEVKTVSAWALAVYADLFTQLAQPVAIWNGSSNFTEIECGVGLGVPYLSLKSGLYTSDYTSCCIPNQETPQLTQRVPVEFSSYVSNKTGTVLGVLFSSGNDVSLNESASQLYANLVAASVAMRATGGSNIKIIGNPYYRRGNFADATRDAVNQLILTDSSNAFDYVLGGKGNNISTLDPRIWADTAASPSPQTYFIDWVSNSSFIHCGGNANAIVASYYIPIFASILGVTVPVASVAPAITGTTTLGSTLTVATGTWSPSLSSSVWQWFRNANPISGATGTTHVLTIADIGCEITVTQAGTSGGYTNYSVASPTAVITGNPLRSNTSATTGSSAATTLNIAYPTGAGNVPVLGDGIFIFVAVNNNGTGITTPSGFALVANKVEGTDTQISLYYKAAVGGDSGNVALAFGSGDCCAVMVVAENVATGSAGNVTAGQTSGSTLTLGSQSPTGGAFLLGAVVFADSTQLGLTPTITIPADMTAIGSEVTATAMGMGLSVGYYQVPPQTATGTQAFTQTGIVVPYSAGIACVVQ
jgi:hypothetical protein